MKTTVNELKQKQEEGYEYINAKAGGYWKAEQYQKCVKERFFKYFHMDIEEFSSSELAQIFRKSITGYGKEFIRIDTIIPHRFGENPNTEFEIKYLQS